MKTNPFSAFYKFFQLAGIPYCSGRLAPSYEQSLSLSEDYTSGHSSSYSIVSISSTSIRSSEM